MSDKIKCHRPGQIVNCDEKMDSCTLWMWLCPCLNKTSKKGIFEETKSNGGTCEVGNHKTHFHIGFPFR